MRNALQWAALAVLALSITGCTTTAPSAECVLDLYAPLDDAEIDAMLPAHARWHDVLESSAKRICK